MIYSDQAEDKLEMLKWLSEKNRHVPISELAYMLDMPHEDEMELDEPGIHDWN